MQLPELMAGAVLTGPEQIEIREVAVPEPGPGELLVRIEAATTCGTDVKVFKRGGHPRMLKVPTLFVAGEEDVVIKLAGQDTLQRMEQLVPDLRDHVMVPGAGHFVQQEQPDPVNEALVGFLETL